MFKLLIKSVRSRLLPVSLVIITLMASMVLLLSIERVQKATEAGFNQSISGVDTIIGPRSSSLELVLYTVFHLGRPTNNITMKTIDYIKQREDVEYLVPIALGDSHQGFRVIATEKNYFKYIKYSGDKPLSFSSGQAFEEISGAVIGADVAKRLNYQVGTKIHISHGSSRAVAKKHDDFSFQVKGVLKKTGTPIDQAVFIDLRGYELIHLGWQSGTKIFNLKQLDLSSLTEKELTPKTVTAAFVGLKSKLTLFRFAADIKKYPNEAISAVIPGIALSELWSMVGIVDQGFEFLSWIIIVISLISMVSLIISSIDSRKREMTIYRANGATPIYLSILVVLEAIFIGLTAIIGAIILVTLVTYFATEQLNLILGITPEFDWISWDEAKVFAIILISGIFSSLVPAIIVFKKNLHHTLS